MSCVCAQCYTAPTGEHIIAGPRQAMLASSACGRALLLLTFMPCWTVSSGSVTHLEQALEDMRTDYCPGVELRISKYTVCLFAPVSFCCLSQWRSSSGSFPLLTSRSCLSAPCRRLAFSILTRVLPL